MKKTALIVLLFITALAQAQNPIAKPAPKAAAATQSGSQWDELDAVFIQIITALEKGDAKKFSDLSLSTLDCKDCAGSEGYTPEGAFVPKSVFFTGVSKNFSKAPVFRAMAVRGYSFASAVLKNFKPKNIPAQLATKDLKTYDVWIETYLPDEIAKGHPGTRHCFRFVKLNGKYRFYGLIST